MSPQSIRERLGGLYGYADRWAIWLAAAVLGGVFAALGYAAFKHAEAGYPDFVVGYITLQGSGKAGEYAAAFAFLIGMVAAFHALSYAMKRIADLADAGAADLFYTRTIIAVTPAILWATTSLWPQADRIGFYWAAVALVSLTLLGATLAIRRPHVWLASENVRLLAIIEGSILLPIGAVIGMHGVAMVGNRIGTYLGAPLFTNPDAFYAANAIAAVVGAIAAGIVGLSIKNADRATGIIRTALALVQIPALGLFLVFLPLPYWSQDLGMHYAVPIRSTNWVLFGALCFFGAADIARLWRKAARLAANPALAVSAFTLIAFIVYARTPVPAPLPIPVDDYHAGETLVPWWSMAQHGLLPLWDFSPVRGLVNYEAGALAALFTDNTAAGILSTKQLHVLLIILIVFPPLALALGKWPALFILMFATVDDGPGGIDTIMAGGLALLCWAWLHLTRLNWLIVWFVVGVAAVLIAPGQGGVLVLASIPAGLWQFYQAVREDRRQVIRAGAIVATVAAILLLATPLGFMVAGAVRYGVGQSSVNGIANGIPWQFGTQTYINSWVFEVLRFSWLGVGAIAVVLTLRAWAVQDTEQVQATHERAAARSVAIFAGTTIALLCLVFVTRSVVRLDHGFVGRPGWASIWALTLLLPILIRYALPARAQLTAMIATVAVGSMLTANFSHVGLENMRQQPLLLHAVTATTQNAITGSDIGLPNLGTVGLEKPHAARLEKVKAQLDKLLTPQETFLDMTNNGAQYFYFDRPPPSESTAVYNLITSDQQLRTIETVQSKKVAVALVGPHTVPIDGLYANLRTHLLYRYLLLNSKPVSIDGFDYMVRDTGAEKASSELGASSLQGAEALAFLDRIFPIGDLGNLPRSMGRSADQLDARARVVHELDASTAIITGAERASDSSFVAAGSPVNFTFDLSALNFAGKDAGILQFDLACGEKSMKWPMHISWDSQDAMFGHTTLQANGRNGTHIVPLDAAPRWLMSPALSRLTVTMLNSVTCKSLKLSNVKLMQRLDADKVDQLGAVR